MCHDVVVVAVVVRIVIVRVEVDVWRLIAGEPVV